MDKPLYPRIGEVRGDNMPEWARPEVVAAEQRILTYADALLTWMRRETWSPDRAALALTDYFIHASDHNPGIGAGHDAEVYETHVMVLDKMDDDANRFMMDLLRAAWERRCWRAHYGETEETKRP
jgi:hypothetical protein